MDKIGLITFHDTTNFGSLLQTFGLYKKINDLGFDCEVIDYQCANIVKREIPQPFKFTFNIRDLIREFTSGRIKRKKYNALHAFLQLNIKLSKRCDKETIASLKHEYDKFVIGSDITWGMDIIDSDTTYFLDFENDKQKKTAFAASVGNPWSEDDKKLIKPLLQDFQYVAVREEESADWVEELTGKRPNVVCDPTMLLTGAEWMKYCSSIYDKSNYVLVYFDNSNGDCVETAKEYAKKYNLRVKLIGYGRPRADVDIVRPYSLDDFLSLIYNASFVVTASYHGMLFSIYFNKNFAYFNRAHKSRMNTLAAKLGVKDREGSEYNVLDMMPVNYSKVNALVDKYRDYSLECLKYLLTR